MSSSPTEYLRHMLAEAKYLLEQCDDLDRAEFLSDETFKRDFIRSIEIIGEAAKHVSEDFRQLHAECEWRAMAGMRDHLIHGYFGVDYELVWDVVANKIPVLREQLDHILLDIDRE